MASTALMIRLTSSSRSSVGLPIVVAARWISRRMTIGRPSRSARSCQCARVIDSALSITAARSTGSRVRSSRWRANSRMRLTTAAPSRAACSITPSICLRSGSPSSSSSSWALPRMPDSKLLKSCATPEASSPSARSRAVRMSCSCARCSSLKVRCSSS